MAEGKLGVYFPEYRTERELKNEAELNQENINRLLMALMSSFTPAGKELATEKPIYGVSPASIYDVLGEKGKDPMEILGLHLPYKDFLPTSPFDNGTILLNTNLENPESLKQVLAHEIFHREGKEIGNLGYVSSPFEQWLAENYPLEKRPNERFVQMMSMPASEKGDERISQQRKFFYNVLMKMPQIQKEIGRYWNGENVLNSQ